MMLSTLVLAVSLAAPSSVSVAGNRWASMQEPSDRPVDVPRPFLHGAEISLVRRGDEVQFRARYAVRAADAGWINERIAPADAHLTKVLLDGRPVPVASSADGLAVIHLVKRDAVLEVSGSVRRRLGEVLGLAAVPGVVAVQGDPLGLEGAVRRGARTWWTTTAPLVLADAAPPSARSGDLVFGEAAVGLTVADTEVRGQAVLRWRIARGSRRSVSFTLPGAGRDLDITGPQVAGVERSGDTVTVQLGQPESALVTVKARWTVGLGDGAQSKLQAPVPKLPGTFRTTHTLQLARDSTLEVVPSVTGFQSVAASTLPLWARGLVEGQPTAAYASDKVPTATVHLLRVTPAKGPPTLVDVASYRMAATSSGRLLMRAHYAVRNDRAARLWVVPPPGMAVAGARVAGDTAKLVRDGNAVGVPLARSVETVQGLLTFPVEITLIGEGPAWSRRGEHRLALPSIDAPIAVSRATVFLPPDRRRGRKDPSPRIVDAFTEGDGITYGFAAGDARAAQADAVFQSAVSAWMSNEFEQAQELVDDLGEMGASNPDVKRLQSNLSVVLEGETAGVDVAQARRVKELARARAVDDVVEQERVLREADERFAAGDYEAAEQAYSDALELGGKLERIAADEDAEVRSYNARVADKLEVTRYNRGKDRTVIDFDGVDVSGELVTPQGQVLMDVPEEPEPVTEPEAAVVEEVVVTSKFQGVLSRLAGRSRQAAPKKSKGRTSASRRAPPPPTDGPSNENTYLLDGVDISDPVLPSTAAAPTVTATSASVVIPELGETVLYQRLLLPPGATDEVVLTVRPRRKR